MSVPSATLVYPPALPKRVRLFYPPTVPALALVYPPAALASMRVIMPARFIPSPGAELRDEDDTILVDEDFTPLVDQ